MKRNYTYIYVYINTYIYMYKAAKEGEAQELQVPEVTQKVQDRNFDLSKI